jgi:hypothetical protein
MGVVFFMLKFGGRLPRIIEKIIGVFEAMENNFFRLLLC